ncbi:MULTISPECIES: quinone oxidoreductase family protein [Streptomyces]|uniref:Zinc-binding alcohol dehydrogenase family protein n=1 Tax=Streptomyces eurythermus TaxID=42237 RepID=A0ABW6Z9Q1_9ACTN|nr:MULTISPECIES: zinc-binding dehydrogenase [Streptomyces]QIS74326.1 zinc-binding dehydrogenase [Streptomyces sp. DSM 40868]WDM16959.1 zinc-binding dehydrogenase [Streptomyces lavenduligriseus]
MRAVLLKDFGPPDRLTVAEVPDPRPARGEVTIRVAAVGIQFLETQVRSGMMRGALGGAPLPVILGKEIAGEVIEAGEGVDAALVGSRVLATTGGVGGYAELATAPADELVPVPDGLDFRDAVALYRYGATARGLIDAARVGEGDRVLVQAAAGAVGTILVQLLKRAGATVIGTARGAAKLGLVKELGADHVIDYSLPGWTEQVRQAAGGAVEVVYDHVGGELGRDSFSLLAPGAGRQIVFGFSSGQPLDVKPMELFGRGLTLTGFSAGLIWNRPAFARELVTDVLGLAVAGEIKPVIGQSYPLERAAEAHAAVEARSTIGKTLLIP